MEIKPNKMSDNNISYIIDIHDFNSNITHNCLINLENVTNFLIEVNFDFPVPLSNKVDISEYAKKIINNATIIAAIDKTNSIIGLVCGYTNNLIEKTSYISLVGVKKEYRKCGIAKLLLKTYLAFCNKKGIALVHLYTDKSNVPAIKMYNDLGFNNYKIENEQRPNDLHLCIVNFK